MKCFEYKHVMPANVPGYRGGMIAWLNKLGDEGWELIPSESLGYTGVIFKREVER